MKILRLDFGGTTLYNDGPSFFHCSPTLSIFYCNIYRASDILSRKHFSCTSVVHLMREVFLKRFKNHFSFPLVLFRYFLFCFCFFVRYYWIYIIFCSCCVYEATDAVDADCIWLYELYSC